MSREPSEDRESQKDDASSNLSYLNNKDKQQEDLLPQDDKKRNNDANKPKPQITKKQPTTLTQPPKPQRTAQQADTSTDGIFLYKPGVQLPNLYPFLQQQIKIIIASQYINKNNPEYIRRNIFGSEIYTSNSDAVCIAVHSQKLNINSFNHRKYEGVELICKVTKPKKIYPGGVKNGFMSRSIKGYDGNAIKPEFMRNLTSLGPPQLLEKYAANMHIPIGCKRVKAKPRNINSVIPIPQTHIVFNMNNQPAYKYSLFNIADRGFDKTEWVIKKLDANVLYLESEDTKYELLKRSDKEYFEVFRFSIVKNPDKIDNEFMAKNPAPLSQDLIDVIFNDAEWDEIHWGNNSIQVKDRNFTGIRSFKYYKIDPKFREKERGNERDRG